MGKKYKNIKTLTIATVVFICIVAATVLSRITTQATDTITLTINNEKTITLTKNSCTNFVLGTITTSGTNTQGYNLKVYNRVNDSNNITIKKQDDTIIPTNPSNPVEITNTTSPATNEELTTTYQACTNNSITNGDYNTTIAYIIQENIRCVQGPQFKGNVGNMQNIDTGSWNQGDTGIAIDIRNNQEYCIGKLKDDKTWMLDNLKLELENGMTLTPQDTNVASNTTVYFTQNGTQNGTPLAGMTGNFTTSGHLTTTNEDPGYDNDYSNRRYNAWRQVDPSDRSGCKSGSAYSPNSKVGCGYLYNFYTAAASSVDHAKVDGTADGSICPAGWKLPTGVDASGDFGQLDIAYGGTGAYRIGAPAQLANLWLPTGAWQGALSGNYLNQWGNNQGFNGWYWSSSIISAIYAYNTLFDSNRLWPGTDSTIRIWGISVRCLVN
ncbi:MAG: fibrobacter succinogenes major paralogous domain-containing protein [Candidatus Nomurabacteria bacterium]|jgi:hypothetical protein|nr:fibrobacter succinogenes major paralogous domain-containing protein [Candidatus Nomurabacteria bacterium]